MLAVDQARAAAGLLGAPPARTGRDGGGYLWTYVVGNALFWVLWGGISISSDRWYWWPVVPLVGWVAVLGLRLRRPRRERVRERGVVMGASLAEDRLGGTGWLPPAARTQLPWIAAGILLGFLVPFVFTDLFSINRDLYYGIYALAVVGFVAAWLRATDRPLRALLERHWRLALLLALLVAAALSLMVLRTEDATSRPAGAALVGAVVWRGLVYGIVDGLLMSSFPILAVFASFEGTRLRARRRGTVLVAVLAVAASVATTAAYHLGYSELRSEKLRSPVAGSIGWGLPTLLTLNPVGAPIAHAAMHTTVVLHAYDTHLFLPPHE